MTQLAMQFERLLRTTGALSLVSDEGSLPNFIGGKARSSVSRVSNTDLGLYLPGGRTGILLIHGLGGTPLQMRYLARGLARSGYTVSCPQLAGHCRSPEALLETDWQDWYASSEAAFEALKEDCDQVIVAGLSGGAVLALNLAAEHHDEILGAVVFSPTFKLNGWAMPWYLTFFNLVRHRWFAKLLRFDEREPFGVEDERVRTMVKQAMSAGDNASAGQSSISGALLLELRWMTKAVTAKLSSITKPVLIIHPRHDDRASLQNTAMLQQKLGGMVETQILDNSYHIVTIDKGRQDVVDRTTTFADTLAPVEADLHLHELKAQAAE